MKFIIDGKTCNTGTATKAGTYSYEDDMEREVEATIYRTRSGAVFVVQEWEIDNGYGSKQWKARAESLTENDLVRLSEVQAIEIIDEEALRAPEEEGSEEETIYLRVPRHLKAQIAVAAGEHSVNSWASKALKAALPEKAAAAQEAESASSSPLVSQGLRMTADEKKRAAKIQAILVGKS
jgi:hypothetical protein